MNDTTTPSCSLCQAALAVEDATRWRCLNCSAEYLVDSQGADAGKLSGDGDTLPLAEGIATAGRLLFYGLSLPERATRSSIGLAAGAARDTARFLVPRAFQDSRTYGLVVRNSLNFLATNIGGVRHEDDTHEPPPDDFLARKAVGNFVDMAGWATLSCSPVWLMAVVSDVAYGARAYTQQLATELQSRGLIDEQSTVHSIDDLLAALQGASGEAAGLLDAPPLSIQELKATLEATRSAIAGADVSTLVPEHEIESMWREMQEMAAEQDVGLLGISGAMTMLTLQKVSTVGQGALTGIQVVGGLLDREIVGHYRDALTTLREQGFYNTLVTASEPYIDAVWDNFSVDQETWTEALLSGRAISQGLSTVANWLTGTPKQADSPADEADAVTDEEESRS